MACRPLRTEYYDGWILRISQGCNRRANSATPLCHSTMPLDRKLAYCEAVFERAGLPCVFKMTSASKPLDLDRHLEIMGRDAMRIPSCRHD